MKQNFVVKLIFLFAIGLPILRGDASACTGDTPYYNNLNSEDQCVTSCEANYYIDSKTSFKICVQTCSDNYPYLDKQTDPNHHQCVEQCPDNYPYIDSVNYQEPTCVNNCEGLYIDPSEHPKCTEKCPKTGYPYYNITNHPFNYCVAKCENGYIDNLTNSMPTCVTICNLKNTSYYGVKTENPYCSLECPEYQPYLDIISQYPVCVNACPQNYDFYQTVTKGDYTFKQCSSDCDTLIDSTAPQSCVEECLDERPFIDQTGLHDICRNKCPDNANYAIANALGEYSYQNSREPYYCIEACPEEMKFIDSVTKSPQSLCVLNCPNFVNIDQSLYNCVDSCKNYDSFAEYNDSLGIKTCEDTCTSGYANSDYICQSNCNGVQVIDNQTKIGIKFCCDQCPEAYPYTDKDPEQEFYFCVEVCPVGRKVIDRLTKDGISYCVSDCGLNFINDITLENPSCINTCSNFLDTTANPQYCVDECPTNTFVDNFTKTNQKICTDSCGNVLYQNKASLPWQCVKACNVDQWQDDISNPKVCGDSCPGSYEDHTTSTQVCLTNCPENSLRNEINPDKKQCVLECGENFEDKTGISTEFYCRESCPNNVWTYTFTDYKCLNDCGNYIKDNTTGLPHCVSSCNDNSYYLAISDSVCLVECPNDKWIDESTKECLDLCKNDKFTEVKDTKKHCVSSCSEGFYENQITKNCTKNCESYFKNDFQTSPQCTEHCIGYWEDTQDSLNICVTSCSPKFQDSTGDYNKCVTSCGDNYINYIGEVPKCTIDCGEYYSYETNTKKECVKHCKFSGSELLYIEDFNNGIKKCVSSCSSNKPYVINDVYPYCSESCPGGYDILDGYTDSNVLICSTKCPDHDPPLFHNITENGLTVCVYPCPTEYTPFADTITKQKYTICTSQCPLQNYFVDTSDFYTCKSECPDNLPFVDMYSREDRAYLCVAQCPNNYYIDSLTFSYSQCVPSCKNLIPLAYVEPTISGSYRCTRQCPQKTFPYLDLTTDFDHPSCVSACPQNAKYIDALTNSNFKICVSSCKYLIPTAYIQDNQCVSSCGLNYIDKSSSNYYIENPTCVSQCPENYYIDTLTLSNLIFCVNSCKNLEPTAYIDNSQQGFGKCVLTCPESYPYIDLTTNSDHPICVDSCPENYYIDNLTSKNNIFCVNSCKNLKPTAYIDNSQQGFGKCVLTCPESYPYIDLTTNSDHPICVDSCPENYYIDNLTSKNNIFCVNSCKNLKPTSYIDNSQQGFGKCVLTCPESYPYIDLTTNSDHPICVDSCPQDHRYIDSLTNNELSFCVDSCLKLVTKAFIDDITNPDKPQCIRQCNSSTAPNLDQVTDSFNPRCLMSCPQQTAKYLDEISNKDVPVCLNECKELAPYDNEATDPLIPKCLTKCLPGTYSYKSHCLACESPCEECFETATKCTKCAAYNFLTNNQCQSVCPDGQYGESNDLTCRDCEESCATCSGKLATNCSSCNDNYIFTTKNECKCIILSQLIIIFNSSK